MRNNLGKYIERLLRSFPFVSLLVLSIITALGAVLIFGINDPNNLSLVEKLYFYTAESITISICVGIIYYHIQINYKANSMQDHLEKYNYTIELAELLHQSKKNYGFRGLTKAVDEEKALRDLAKEEYTEENYPTIYWMNFRIDEVLRYAEPIRDYLGKGGHLYIVIHSYDDELIVNQRMEQLRAGYTYESNSNQETANPYENGAIFVSGMVQRTARWINFYESVKELKGNFHIRFNKGSIGMPLFILEKDLHIEAFIGFYMLKRSGELPYVEWQTSPSGLVRSAKSYFEFSFENAIEPDEMKEKEEVKEILTDTKFQEID